jgi:class 3 adenylate cyclase
VLDVEGWAKPWRERFVRGVPIQELARQTGLASACSPAGRRFHRPGRILATMMLTDIVGSTARASEHGDSRWVHCWTATTISSKTTWRPLAGAS